MVESRVWGRWSPQVYERQRVNKSTKSRDFRSPLSFYRRSVDTAEGDYFTIVTEAYMFTRFRVLSLVSLYAKKEKTKESKQGKLWSKTGPLPPWRGFKTVQDGGARGVALYGLPHGFISATRWSRQV